MGLQLLRPAYATNSAEQDMECDVVHNFRTTSHIDVAAAQT